MGLADLTSRLRLDISQFTSAMNTARLTTQRFASQMAAASNSESVNELIGSYRSLNDRLRTVGASFRDISRIVSGIMISQTFYGIANAISEATNALWEFNKELDFAQVTYSALFNSTSVSTDFLETLKDFSVDTIFEYSDLENMARKLLAYGIEYKNLMYIIEGLTNIGTLSGDAAALERLAVAIGQINAKGVLKAEEMRQLTNAYAPMYDILREKFNLTDEDLKSVGDLGITAADTIDAIVEYANERFGDVATSAMYTIKGLNNRIVDSIKVMGADMLKPFTDFYKSLAKYIADQLGIIQGIYEKSGIGGVFEYLIPSEEWQSRIRNLLAALKNFVSTVIVAFQTLGPSIIQLVGGLIDAFTIVLSVINSVAGGLLGFVHNVSTTTPVIEYLTKALLIAGAAWAFFRLQALASAIVAGVKVAIVGVAKAVVALASAIMAHPLVSMLVLLGAVLLGVSSNASNANSAIGKLMNTLNSYSAGGNTADDMLQVGDAMGDVATDSEQFWESMNESAANAEDAANSAGDAADNAKKKARGLLSFDEVFRLPEQDKSKTTPTLGGLGDLSGIEDLAGALGGLGEALIPEIPDLSGFAKDFIGTLYDELWDALKTIGSGAATGALIGGMIGFAIGGLVTRSIAGALTGAKWGAKIGAIAGGAFAGFWTETYKQLEDSLIRIAVGSGAGMLVGGLVGMVIGAFATKNLKGAILGAKWGTAIGSIIGAGLGAFWASASAEMSNAIEGILVGGGAGALVGGLAGLIIGAFATKTLKGAIKGAEIGVAIGGLIGGAIGGIFSDSEKALINAIGRIAAGGAEGALIGGLAGMVLGAFATKTLKGALTGAGYGAAIGTAIGGTVEAVFGDAEETVSSRIGKMFSTVESVSKGMLIGAFAGMILGAAIGAFAGGIGALPGAQAGATLGAMAGALTSMLIDYLESIDAAGAVGGWLGGLATAIDNWTHETGQTIQAWSDGVKESISAWASDTWTSFTTWVSDTYNEFTTWSNELDAGFIEWANGVDDSITKWADDTKKSISTWSSDTWTSFTTWISDTWNEFTTWSNELDADFLEWANGVDKSITDWSDSTRQSISTWASNTWTSFTTWTSNTKKDISNWSASFKSTISTWYTDTKAKVIAWFDDTGKKISTWFTEKKEAVKTGWNDLWDVSKWASGWSSVKTWFNDLFKDIGNWFNSLGRSIASWWDGLFSDKSASVEVNGSVQTIKPVVKAGHATGGIFNREHIARFAEGNKAEAVIPLENNTAMRPFVNMISDGILQGLLPVMATGGSGGSNDLPPMYVGTLIADDRGLQQLYKKFQIIEAKELARKGLA